MMSICNGRSVSISGNRATIDGKTYTLPPHSSISINNADIYLDGKRWDPARSDEMEKAIKRMGHTLLTKEYVSEEAPIKLDIRHVGTVTVVRGERYRLTLKVRAYGTADASPLPLTFEPGEVDLSGMDEMLLESSSVHLELPEIRELVELTALVLDDIRDYIRVSSCCGLRMTLRIQGGSAGVHIKESMLKTIEIGSGPHRIELFKVSAESLTASTASGSVHVTDCGIERIAQLRTMSGSCVVTGAMAAPLLIETMSGSVRLSEFWGRGGFIETMSGSVTVCQHPTKPLESLGVTTMSGSLHGQGRTKVKFQTMSGSNHYKQAQEARELSDGAEGEKKKKKRTRSSDGAAGEKKRTRVVNHFLLQ